MSGRMTGGEDGAPADWAADLLQVVSRVQRLVSEQAPPEAVYQATVDGIIGLLHADSGAVRFVDPADPAWMVAVASRAVNGLGEQWRARSPITEGATGKAITSGSLVVLEDDLTPIAGSSLAPPGTSAVIAHPVRERGDVVGVMVAGSRTPGRRWSRRDREVIAAYAAHLEIPLMIARASQGRMLAYRDPLTGLGNRALLIERAKRRIAITCGSEEEVSVLFLDLDRFKLVNDSLGHVAGNKLLVAVGERLRRIVREDDVCVRLSGDEFAVLLAAGGDAETAGQRIISGLSEPFDVDGVEVFVGVSVGIAAGRESAETLLRNADVAMDHAKASGAGRLAHFSPSMHAARLSRLGIDAELRHAVERGELELHFQPLFHLSTGALAAFESLVRWRHPDRGLVVPSDFIPLAEETGLIVEIDRWVLGEACRRFATWWRDAPLAISVNVTLRDLQQPDFAQSVRDAIGDRFPSSALVLEVTESGALAEDPQALAALHGAKQLGVRLALDDFGTGYSSMLTLSQLPVDVVKVARPFVDAAVPGDAKAQRMLAGMLALARHLELFTVAEGIETEQQRELLVELGCDAGQGFLLGRPLSAAAAEQLVQGAPARP
jgi:diguanylate cyclase (GGDEF)-like protein